MKKKILILLACIIASLGVLCGIYIPDSEINNVVGETQNIVVNEIKKEDSEVVVSEQTGELVIQTKEAINREVDISTTEIIESSEDEEQELEVENIEKDAQVEQENISYNGDSTGNGLSFLSDYQGLTYYSQADSRWASVMYSSKNDKTQTMKSSACGPTSAAMIVSSSKGAILPTTLAQLAVDNGYRTANSGTAWAFFPFVADYFNFNEYHSTCNFDTMLSYLSQKNSDGSSKYYVIASCRKWIVY